MIADIWINIFRGHMWKRKSVELCIICVLIGLQAIFVFSELSQEAQLP